MPEEIEIETEKLRESIEEELEHGQRGLIRAIALSTAVLAVFAAIAALQAGSTVNEALVLKTEATRLQAQASDQWAYYQAKGIKLAIAETSRGPWLASGKTPPAAASADAQRYRSDQQKIEAEARKLEGERDEKSREADHLLHRHHGFANAVAMFQVAIALGAIAALTRLRPVWIASIAIGLGGAAFFVGAFVR